LEQTDRQLISRALRGDSSAFHKLVDQQAQHLFGMAYALLGNASDAEDVVQETFLAAFRGLSRFEQRSSFRTWLVAILGRQVALLRRKRRGKGTVALELVPGEGPTQPSLDENVDVRLDVAQLLQQLSPDHRNVLVLREYEGMSYDEIAQALKIPRGTVESRLYRARQELKDKLTGYQGADL
jgi:RNA polymerase sigma-70 factor, ECF subfamily